MATKQTALDQALEHARNGKFDPMTVFILDKYGRLAEFGYVLEEPEPEPFEPADDAELTALLENACYMKTIFVEREPIDRQYFVTLDDGDQQYTVSGPWATLEIAQVQAEYAAKQRGAAEWTLKPEAVARREEARRGIAGSRSAWVVA
jgi:hypothetical protein